jgi:beta-lactamase regulating signal transducer with metallopeptidase domain
MLLHSLWQGAVVAMGLAVVLCVLRRAPAQARYLGACAAMILIVALPVATLRPSNERQREPRPHRDATAAPAIVVTMTPIAPDRTSTPRLAELRAAEQLKPMLPAIVGLWIAGVGVFSLRLVGGWVQARCWVRNRTQPRAEHWPERVERLKERLGIRRAVALLDSVRVEVPMVVGWLRPAILVPAAALSGLSVPELEAILAHELAHIRRHDYLINLIQCVVEVLTFYHPATWWISHVIRREREVCCDDLAVMACRDRVTYARALAAMEGLRGPAFSPSPAANGGILLARVRRILKPQEESMNPVRILAGLAVVLAAAPLWFARAGDDPPAAAASAQSRTVPFPNRSFADLLTQVEQARSGRNDPFPGRTFADVVTSVESAPTGSLLIDVAPQPAGIPRVPAARGVRQEGPAWIGFDDRTLAFLHRSLRQQDVPAKPNSQPMPPLPTSAVAQKPAAAEPHTSDAPHDPPTEAEVWALVPKWRAGGPASCRTRREIVRIVVEKICDKVAPVRTYHLVKPCQLVHKHYKCTVYYDAIYDADYPIPFHHVDHKVEVVYIDRDHLRRAAMPGSGSSDQSAERRLELITREIEYQKRPSGRCDQYWRYDRLVEDLEGPWGELRDDPEEAPKQHGSDPDPEHRADPGLPLEGPVEQRQRDESAPRLAR